MSFYRSFFYTFYSSALLFIFFFFISCGQDKLNTIENDNDLTVKAYQIKDSSSRVIGWGYDIYLKDNRIIHQPIIPAIEGVKPFKTLVDALSIGNLSISKMKKGNNALPTISIKELDSLKIIR
ncbi:MAG TPA: DUF4907 domain-containing protein [Bacteroidia bacterium]|jgi:hypothetical protein|nr:DUF4907 domain-containing protein [Bacteroidia bacterium]